MRFLVLSSLTLLAAACASSEPEQGTAQDAASGTGTGEKLEPATCGSIKQVHALGGIYLAGQPSPADLELARQDGVRTVISLRHASEIEFDERAVAEGLGLTYVSLPWNAPAELTDEVFARARELLRTAERPILLHCGSANRVGAVWLPYRVLDGGLAFDDALAEAKAIGLRTPEFVGKARDYVARQQAKM